MYTDAHCHPWNLLKHLENAEEERRKTGTAIAASSWNIDQFEYHENIKKKAREEGAPPVFCCFARHPQLSGDEDFLPAPGLELLKSLAAEGRLDAVGETGFDLYDERYRAGEKVQDEIFACHLETALQYGLPLVLHLRRAMHKIFPFAKELKKLPAVVFHCWPGTKGEGEALLRRGINAFFSFGTAVLKNHKEAIACAAIFPPERLLLETDAPYQPLRGKAFSSWRELNTICRSISEARKGAGSLCCSAEELRGVTTANFYRAFGLLRISAILM
jgi:TatD DNase family protein